MVAKTLTGSWPSPRNNGRPGRVRDGVLSVLLGAGFTVALFAGIAWYDRSAPLRPPADLDDFAISALPLDPPPPPVTQTEPRPEIAPIAGFDLAPSESAVKIEASLPPLELVRPADASRTPVARIALGLPPSFRPRADLRADTQHIYQRAEVDTIATVLIENLPQGSRALMDGAAVLHVNLIWVIEPDGTVSNVRVGATSGKPKFDALMMEMIKDSVFSPARKGGRKVRMITSQQITVKWTEGSIFQQ
jgi:outer membrane biosynthesis protein TonB